MINVPTVRISARGGVILLVTKSAMLIVITTASVTVLDHVQRMLKVKHWMYLDRKSPPLQMVITLPIRVIE